MAILTDQARIYRGCKDNVIAAGQKALTIKVFKIKYDAETPFIADAPAPAGTG